MRREIRQLSALVEQGAFAMEVPNFPTDRIVTRTILPPSRNLLAAILGRGFAERSWRWCGRRAARELGAVLARFAQAHLTEFEAGAERTGRTSYAASGLALEAGPVLHLVERGTVSRVPLPLLRGWRVEDGALHIEAAERSWRIPLADPSRWARLLVDRRGPSALG